MNHRDHLTNDLEDGGSELASNARSLDSKTSWQHAFSDATESSNVAVLAGIMHPYCPHVTRSPSPHQLDLPQDDDDTTASSISSSPNNARLLRALHEASRIVKLALPLASANISSYGIGIVSIAFAGRLGSDALAAVVLGTSLLNITGISIIQGLNAALETFCGQAYGSRNYLAVGIVLQRAVLINTLFSIIIMILWRYLTIPFLGLLGQDPALAASAAQYLAAVAPALWFAAIYEALKRYLAVQGLGRPGAIVTGLALALCPFYNWLFIYRLEQGLLGAAVAMVAVQVTMAAGLIGYTAYLELYQRIVQNSEERTYFGLSREAFFKWPDFLKFSLPAIIMTCAEWWIFEAYILLSGKLENPQSSLAVMGICLNLSALIWSGSSGLGLSTSARVASSLGAGLPAIARRTAFVSLAIGFIFVFLAASTVLVFRHSIGFLFTSDPDLVASVCALMPIFALSLPGDAANSVLQGLLRGSGKQDVGAVTNLCSYWIVGLPLAYYFAFTKGMGLSGIWLSVAMVNTLQGGIMLTIALKIDFEKESEKAIQRSADLVAPLLGPQDDLEIEAGTEEMQQEESS